MITREFAGAAAVVSLAGSLGPVGAGNARATGTAIDTTTGTQAVPRAECTLAAGQTGTMQSGTGTAYASCPWGNAPSVEVRQRS
jgi:hypothetical protein